MVTKNRYELRFGDGVMPQVDPELVDDAELFDVLLNEIRGLFRERNNVYRSRFRDNGIAGTMSLIGYKIQRLSSQLNGEDGAGSDEDLTEGFLDLAVYSLLAALLSHYGEESAACRHLFAAQIDTAPEPSEQPWHEQPWHCVLCGARAQVTEQSGAGD